MCRPYEEAQRRLSRSSGEHVTMKSCPQVAEEIFRNPDDKTIVHLVYASVSEDDIMLKPKIDDLAKQHKNFKVIWLRCDVNEERVHKIAYV